MRTTHHNPYDEILIRRAIAELLVLYLRPEWVSGRFVAPSLKAYGIVRRRPDWLRLWYANPGDARPKTAAQVEIQTTIPYDMTLRMSEYFGVLRRKLKVKLEQFVFYFGEAPLKLKSRLHEPPVDFDYTLCDVRALPAAYFIQIGTPDALLLAFLCGYEGDGETHVRTVLRHIFAQPFSAAERQELLDDLDTIANLRTFEKQIFIRVMKTDYIKHYPEIKTTFHFQEGFTEGRQETQRSVAQNMKTEGYPLAAIARILNLTPAEIERLLNDESPQE